MDVTTVERARDSSLRSASRTPPPSQRLAHPTRSPQGRGRPELPARPEAGDSILVRRPADMSWQ
eukprot:6483254-Alexandrium_andersonii.AAC.1